MSSATDSNPRAISNSGLSRRSSDGPDFIPPRSVFLAVCAYMPVLCLIPMLTRSADDFVKFHARQGLALFITEFLVSMLFFLPSLGVYLAGVLLVLIFVLMIVAVAEVLQGRYWKLPLFRGLSGWIDL